MTAAPAAPAAMPAQAGGPTPATVLEGLHPGWFGAVMGTAVVGVAAYANPGHLRATGALAHAVGVGFVALAAVLAVVLATAYLARWARHPSAALADLRHPVLGPLYSTVPGGLLVLAVAIAAVAPSLPLSHPATLGTVTALTAVGAASGFAASIVFAYLLFTGDIAVSSVNGGWFIPPVVTIIIPAALAPLIPHTHGQAAALLIALGYAFFGMGLLLFLFVMSLLHDRLVLHPLPGATMAPSLWIGLGPVGAGALSLLVLTGPASPALGPAAPTVRVVTLLAATGLWGFGAWWLATATTLLVRYLRRAPLPYGPGWWGFTFPVGAYALATLLLARTWHTPALEWSGVVLFAALLGFWAAVAAGTVRAVATGKAWTR